MATHEEDGNAPWEPPAAIALTDTQSRADHADVVLENAPPAGSPN